MKCTRLTKNLVLLSLSALCAGTIAAACSSKGGGGDGGNGGDQGGSGGDSGGSGGDSSSGGKGGTASGGKGGSATGGGAGGGSGGAPMTGGSGGVAMTGGNPGTAGMASAGAPKFCNDPTWYVGSTDGTHTAADIAKSKGSVPPAGPAGEVKGAGVNTNYTSLWIPAQYKDAKDGEVGLVIVLGLYDSAQVGGRARGLIPGGDIPPVVIAKGNFTDAAKAKLLLSELRAAYPKISTKPEYITIVGQSTTGAQAFDIAWAEPSSIGNVITSSGSFVCFQPNKPYPGLVSGAAKKNLRVSMVVGNCDIFGDLEKRIAAGCSNASDGGSIDTSGCGATWIDANKELMAALTAKGYSAQLLLPGTAQSPAGHTIGTAMGAIDNQLRFVYRPVVCK